MTSSFKAITCHSMAGIKWQSNSSRSHISLRATNINRRSNISRIELHFPTISPPLWVWRPRTIPPETTVSMEVWCKRAAPPCCRLCKLNRRQRRSNERSLDRVAWHRDLRWHWYYRAEDSCLQSNTQICLLLNQAVRWKGMDWCIKWEWHQRTPKVSREDQSLKQVKK